MIDLSVVYFALLVIMVALIGLVSYFGFQLGKLEERIQELRKEKNNG